MPFALSLSKGALRQAQGERRLRPGWRWPGALSTAADYP